MNIPITAKSGKLPASFEVTPGNYRKILLQRMALYLSSSGTEGGQALLGSTDSRPTANIGAWFNSSDSMWYAWDNDLGQYNPVTIGFLNSVTSGGFTRSFGLSVVSSPTANRTLTLPDKSGTAATITDIAVPRATVILTGTTPTIDAGVSDDFYLELSGNTTFPPISNMPTGGRIKISVANVGTSFTVTWPSSGANEVKWVGSAPVQPVSAPGQKALGIYTIREINVGLTPHLWGDPEISGFNAPPAVDPGGSPDPGYGGSGGGGGGIIFVP